MKEQVNEIKRLQQLAGIIKEIGDASSEPYYSEFISDFGDVRNYGFYSKDYPYTVELTQSEEAPNELYIRFFVPDENDPDIERDDIVTDKGEVFKIMSSVKSSIDKDLKKHPEIDTLIFTPAEKSGKTNDQSRKNLYLRYINSAYPNAEIKQDGKTLYVKIK
jgi:hypothetical protein